MLAIKKKREKKDDAASKKISILGIGGIKQKEKGSNGKGKKRTPGEIRIQKGMLFTLEFFSLVYFTVM